MEGMRILTRTISTAHNGNLYKTAAWLFTAMCVVSLGYMTENQINKYYRNEDSSSVSFKKFGKKDYPT